MVSGTTNVDSFYQDMMGDYVLYPEYPILDFSKMANVNHDLVKRPFPVYYHSMLENNPNGPKYAYLYYYYNVEPRVDEIECPEGCWIIS